jgi:hypothetical protein
MTEHAQTSDRRWVDLLEREVGANWPPSERLWLRAALKEKLPPIPVSLFSAR